MEESAFIFTQISGCATAKTQTVRMRYRDYKQHYADCETVENSYNKADKSVYVIVPDGRMKKSGVRGETFKYMWFDGVDEKGSAIRVCIKAVSMENAIKRLPKEYPGCTFTY